MPLHRNVKGKPIERWGRKVTGLRLAVALKEQHNSMVAGPPNKVMRVTFNVLLKRGPTFLCALYDGNVR